jgi:protein-L-isoaspartate O-methyltransferase
MAETARHVFSVEIDPERARMAARELKDVENIELLQGDWRDELPPRGPFPTSSGKSLNPPASRK